MFSNTLVVGISKYLLLFIILYNVHLKALYFLSPHLHLTGTLFKLYQNSARPKHSNIMLKLYELKTFYFLYHNVKYVYTQHKGLPIHLLIYLKERVGRGATHSKSMEPNVTKCRRGSSIHQTCRPMN